MSPDLVAEMRRLLAEERDAIRRLDAQKVESVARAKEALLASLRSTQPTDREAAAQALGELRAELRRNLVLLAHARDCMRDAISHVRPTSGGSGRVCIRL